jgi:hypothetical protein
VDNRRYKAAGFHYQHTSRETVMKLGEFLRLHPVVRGAQETYRYEREVEDFLRWSPHVKNTRDRAASGLTREQVSELQRLLSSFADTAGMDLSEDIPDRAAEAERRAAAAEEAAREAADRAGRAEEAARERAAEAEERARAEAERVPPGQPVDHYDDLAAEEVIALLASLEYEDLQMLREYERDHANRTRVLSAIDSVLSRRGSRV